MKKEVEFLYVDDKKSRDKTIFVFYFENQKDFDDLISQITKGKHDDEKYANAIKEKCKKAYVFSLRKFKIKRSTKKSK